MRLNELRAALENQFDKIKILDNQPEKSNQQTYEIDDCATKVFVEMRRKREEIDDNVQICGGKLCTDSAQVTINPQNEQVNNVVVGYFTKMITDFDGDSYRQFDHITINSKKI